MSEVESILTSLLDPGETLLWSGQPKGGIRLQPQDAVLIPFSLAWGGFAFFWEANALGLVALKTNGPTHPPPLFFALWGIPFVLMGLYMIIGRFFFDAASRAKTSYGVTDRRLIVLKRFPIFSLNSVDLGSSVNLSLTERSNGSGDILFGLPGPGQGLAGAGWPTGRTARTPGFYLLPDARKVFALIREASSAARRT